MKKTTALFFCMMTFLNGCCRQPEHYFVDERFYMPMYGFSRPVNGMRQQLTPTEDLSVVDTNDYKSWYYGCKITENRKNFVAFECKGKKARGIVSSTYPRPKKITYEITPERDNISHFYLVTERSYEWSSSKQKWTGGGGMTYYIEDEMTPRLREREIPRYYKRN